MGHRLSKSNWISSSSSRNTNEPTTKNTYKSSSSSSIDLTATTNRQIGNVTSPSTIQTQFVIKIQLTKMEPGNPALDDNDCRTNGDCLDNNLNINKPILNWTFTKNILCDATTSSNDDIVIDTSEIKLNNLNSANSNNNLNNSLVIHTNFTNNLNNSTVCLQDFDCNSITYSGLNNMNMPSNISSCSSTNISKNINSIDMNASNNNTTDITTNDMHAASVSNINNSIIPENISNISSNSILFGTNDYTGVPDSIEIETNNNSAERTAVICGKDNKSHCCMKKISSAYPTTIRCCQIADKECDNSKNSSASSVDPQLKSSSKRNWTKNFNCTRRNSSTSSENRDLENNISTTESSTSITPPHVQQNFIQSLPGIADTPSVPSNLLVLSMNRPGTERLCHCCDEREKRLRALQFRNGVEGTSRLLPIQGSAIQPSLTFSPQVPIISPDIGCAIPNISSPSNWHCPPQSFGQTVHSQADYIHCLVPDLKQITSSSFYWGKMDRYEAERLLEGKPEGTFLLRDSAQEEYLFSVTFRKYGRSLHARIEQFNHKFSFDCHDPGSFSAFTVTELLEHYKVNCLMVFEPLLTIPLNRSFSFSLQQLCRATIVSNITYDGINELHLPNSLKGYLKEYHYKFRVRVKPFDQSLYTCS